MHFDGGPLKVTPTAFSTRRERTILLTFTHRRDLLKQDFPDIPLRFIVDKIRELGHLYATYLALDLADDAYDTSVPRPYSRLTYPRTSRNRVPPTLDGPHHPGMGYTDLREELDAARAQRRKAQTERQIKRDAAAAEAAEEQELRDCKQVMECGCCFDDVAINKITFCDADDPHSFCFSCAMQNAAVQIGMSRHTLRCMDGSGCNASFSRMERKRFLDSKTMEKLDRLQQQTDLREANLANLESCPFCDFAAICPPIEFDKEFRCSNPECEIVSCRKCRLITHIPLTCEESKKENGISERHLIEEARTMALLKICPKCNASVIKEYGCNRLQCKCGAYICDSCGKDITGENYTHFSESNAGPARGKCRTYDNDEVRNRENMDAAEKEAVKKIREEHPDISEEDLKIKMDKSTETPRRAAHNYLGYQIPNPHIHHGYNIGPGDPLDGMELGIGVPPWLAARRAAMPQLRRNALPEPIPPYRVRAMPHRQVGFYEDLPPDDEQALLDQVLQVEHLAAPPPPGGLPARVNHGPRPPAFAPHAAPHAAPPVGGGNDIGWEDALFMDDQIPRHPALRDRAHLQAANLRAMEREARDLEAESRVMRQLMRRDV
ncbi:MAG: hypothetical protein Q9212_001499, partial [Teloschistes hypoglaucus]